MIFRSLRWRLIVLIFLSVGLVFAAVVSYGYRAAREILEEELEARALYLARATAGELDRLAVAIERAVQSIALCQEMDVSRDREDYERLLFETIDRNSEVSAAGVFYEPDLAPPALKCSGLLARRQNDAVVLHEYPELGVVPYTMQDWYLLPRELQSTIWAEPYYETPARTNLMVTCSAPFYATTEREKLIGVVTCEVSLDGLKGLLSHLPLGQSGYAFLLSSNGTFIAHPDAQLVLNESIFSRAEAMNDLQLRILGKRMIHGEAGFQPFVSLSTGMPCWIAHVPVPSTGWTLAALFPREALLATIGELGRTEAEIAVVGLMVLLVVILFISRSITRPLHELDEAARTLSAGILDAPLPKARGSDELGRLTRSFNTMRDRLRSYMDELRQTVSVKERIESELRVAHAMQMGLVPKSFDPAPEREDLEIYAIMEPARQVGGDFFDFFRVDDRRLCLAIADVSGKGVPAALFMAVARSFLRSFAREGHGPDTIASRLNDELREESDGSMFVTLFCAIIDLDAWTCRYANAGHNPPFVLRAGRTPEPLPRTRGAGLGILPNFPYEEGLAELTAGDVLFLYTDGVTEAMNANGEMFDEPRLKDELQVLQNAPCREMLTRMREALRRFTGNAEQSDDITMLALRRRTVDDSR